MIDGNTKLICLIGSDVSKSLSPKIHNYIYDKYELNYRYMNFSLKENDLEKFIQSVKILDIKGFNVTIPYKEKIIDFLDEIDETAKNIGAVNTVKNIDGKLIGYNTDGAGYVLSLKNNKVDIKNQKILVIGSGGAARGIIYELCKYNPTLVHIKNRTIEKSQKLIDEIKMIYKDIEFNHYCENKKDKDINYEYKDSNNIESIENNTIKTKNFETKITETKITETENIESKNTETKNTETKIINYDLIINTTSIGMKDLKNTPLELEKVENAVVSDIVYIPRETKLLKSAKSKNLQTIEGIEMLIYQGIIADQIWLKKEFDTQILLSEIKDIIFQK